ncbi:MAG: T9SS type A sorting domain-containing protein, partial [Bacteroidetes bacterium]|nr:T9SS type A sorting domain-containing protein [Bacteroidota bacterium]
WTALWDDGSDTDFLVRFDGTDTFRFQPGRGFWLLSSSNWTVDESIATVQLTNQAITIPLHDGWNIISNPLPIGLVWSDVSSANGGNLQPVWAWDGAFQEAATFRSAQSGEAFYFLNDTGRSELTLPLSAANLSGSADAAPTRAVAANRLTLEAAAGGFTSRVAVGESPDAERGRDPLDVVAPPYTGFTSVSLRVAADGPERQQFLARDMRAPSEDGHRYTLVLASPADEPVTLRATGLPEGPDASAVLVNTVTGERHTLTGGPLRLTPSTDQSTYRLLLGSKSFTGATEATAEELVIEKPAPNPFRDRTTLRYTLPEAQDVTIRVYDLLGRRLLTLVDGRQGSGPHSVQWGGTDASGAPIASGMYFVRMTVGDRRVVHKVVHVR